MNEKIKAAAIIALQKRMVEGLHADKDFKTAVPEGEFYRAASENMFVNYTLWHLEDEARVPDSADALIADIKRRIDRENQKRNDLIEKMDIILEKELPGISEEEKKLLPSNTETPGSAVDRMGIASLKIYHMNEEAGRSGAGARHRAECSGKRELLKTQLADLAVSFDTLIADLFGGKKQLRIYRQFKMYNDPSLNPSLYGKQNKG